MDGLAQSRDPQEQPDYPVRLLDCGHPETRYIRREINGGQIVFTRQCMRCERPLLPFLNRRMLAREVPTLDALPILTLQEFERLEERRETAYRRRDILKSAEADRQVTVLKSTMRDEYRAYLQSDDWAWRRAKVIERDQGECQACLSAPATQVHHLTYKRGFDAPLFDLVAICRGCHEKIHGHD